MDQVHVKLLQRQLIAQHTQQKQHVTIKMPVLTKEQLVLHSQEHAQIIQQQLLEDVQTNLQNVLKEHWLVELTHVYLLLLHAQLKHHQTHVMVNSKMMEKHVTTQDQLALHMICQNVQQEQFKIYVLEDVFGPITHVLLKLVLQSLTQPNVPQSSVMIHLQSQFVPSQEQLVPMLLMPLV